jgi:tetrapyrrole methylase family protein/MazG family protein
MRSHKQKGKRTRKAKASLRKPTAAAIKVTARDRAAGAWFAGLMALQRRLRAPNGCPWDREQSHQSLRKFLVEETYEVLDAMDSGDARKFASELGDLLLQVVFHSMLAEEAGKFTASDVIEAVHTKMVRRHPHVFGDAQAETSAAVLKNWEQIKAEERAAERAAEKVGESDGEADKPTGKSAKGQIDKFESILAAVPRSLPAVLEAYQLTRRAAHIGFDWYSLAGIMDKLDEERREIEAAVSAGAPTSVAAMPHVEEEVGDLLFVGVNVARFLGVDPEIALKKANRKFKERFQWMEAAAQKKGGKLADLPRDRMEALWDESKVAEKPRATKVTP